MTGLLGYGAAYEAMNDVDLLVLLGTDFPYQDFLPGAWTVQVDHDPTRLGRRTPLELAVHGDVGATLRAVLPLVEQKAERSFLDHMLHKHAKALEHVVSAYTHDVERHRPIHPEYAARILDEVAYPGRQIIAMSGDGGLGMLPGELLTVSMYQLPVKVIVFNNSALGMVKLEMLVDGLPDYQTDNGGFDYAAIAQAAGIHGFHVDEPTDIRLALKDALAHPGPALVDLATDPGALSIPPHVTAAEVKGFALAAGKTVLDGGVGQMVEMARANLGNIPRPTITG